MNEEEIHSWTMIYKREKTKVAYSLTVEMKPGTLIEVNQGLTGVIDGEKMLSEDEGECDESETDGENDRQWMCFRSMNEEELNETYYEFVLEHLPNVEVSNAEPVRTAIKLETTDDDQCAAPTCSQVFTHERETADDIQLENKSEKSTELSEKSDFIAETERSIPKHICAAFDSVRRRRRAIVVTQRSILLPSLTAPYTKYSKIENERGDENSLCAKTKSEKRKEILEKKWRKKEKRRKTLENWRKREKLRKSEECEILVQSERSKVKYYFAEFDEILRRKAIVVLERCAVPSSSLGAPTKNCKLKNETDSEISFPAETEGEMEKKLTETAEEEGLGVSDGAGQFKLAEVVKPREMCAGHLTRPAENSRVFLTRETSKQLNQCPVASAEECKGAKEGETLEQREKRASKPIERFQISYNSKISKETLKLRDKFRAAVYHRKALERETPEQRDERIERQNERNRKLWANETPEQREKRLAAYVEWQRKANKNKTPEQREKRLAAYVEWQKKAKERETSEKLDERIERQKEKYRMLKANETPEQREKRLAAYVEWQRKAKERETSEKRDKRIERQKEKYRMFKANETPEQREKRIERQTERYRRHKANETPEQREKRLAAAAEWRRKAKERETLEQSKKHLAFKAENEKKTRERKGSQLLEKRHLADAEVEPTDINEDGLSPPDAIFRLIQYSRQSQQHMLTWTKEDMVQELEALKNRCLTNAVAVPGANQVMAVETVCSGQMTAETAAINVRTPILFGRQSSITTIPSVAARPSSSSSAEGGLSPQDGNVVSIKSEVVNENETVDFSSQRVHDKAIKSEFATAVSDVVEDEIEIIFESCVTGMKTKIKSEPNDENKERLTISAEKKNLEQCLATMRKHNEVLERYKKHLAAETERRKKTMEKETPGQLEKHIERNNKRFRNFKAQETPEQCEKRSTVRNEKQKQGRERETPEPCEKRLAAAGEHIEISGQCNKQQVITSEWYKKVIENETPEQRKKRLAVKAKNMKHARAKETPEQREKRLEDRRTRNNKSGGRKRQVYNPKRYRKMIENETPEQRKKRLAVKAKHMRDAKERKRSQQLEKCSLDIAKGSKSAINIASTVINENGLSPQDDNNYIESKPIVENKVNFSSQDGNRIRIKSEDANEEVISSEDVDEQNIIRIKSEVIDENDEADFSSQYYVNENFIKSETSVFEDDDDEIEIDFEAYVETKVKVEPI